MIEKRFVEDAQGSRVLVTFVLPDTTWADAIFLVGDFNDWNPHSLPLERDGAGCWRRTVTLEPGTAYQFGYLCDGERWITESGTGASVPDPLAGGYKGVIATDRRPQPRVELALDGAPSVVAVRA